MKSIQLVLFFVLAMAFNSFGQSKLAQWPELNDFYKILNVVHTPAMKNNMAPLRQNAQALLEASRKLNNSVIPVTFNATEVKPLLGKMVTQCENIVTNLQNGAPNSTYIEMLKVTGRLFKTVAK
jgi:hypothetical protein